MYCNSIPGVLFWPRDLHNHKPPESIKEQPGGVKRNQEVLEPRLYLNGQWNPQPHPLSFINSPFQCNRDSRCATLSFKLGDTSRPTTHHVPQWGKPQDSLPRLRLNAHSLPRFTLSWTQYRYPLLLDVKTHLSLTGTHWLTICFLILNIYKSVLQTTSAQRILAPHGVGLGNLTKSVNKSGLPRVDIAWVTKQTQLKPLSSLRMAIRNLL